VEHRNTIDLTIYEAELHRGLHNDWVHATKHLIKVEMSPTQFADMVALGKTSVTLRWLPKVGMIEDPPFVSKVRQFNKEFEDHIKDIASTFDEVLELASKTKAQKRLIKAIELLKQNIKNNTPFINEQFTEQMEHTVTEAKAQVEAFIHDTALKYGMEQLEQQAPRVPELPEGETKQAEE
jgi:hypothetical protein